MNIEDYQWIQYVSRRARLTSRKKHGHHFHKFDRRHPPEWMIVGSSGLDDKRTLSVPLCELTPRS